jgi:hypothetical protein
LKKAWQKIAALFLRAEDSFFLWRRIGKIADELLNRVEEIL